MAPMTSHKIRYTVMAHNAGDSSFGVFSRQELADELVLLLSRQGVAARVVTVWPHTTGKTIINCLRSMHINPFDPEAMATNPAGGYLRSAEVTSDGPLNVPAEDIVSPAPAVSLAEPERTTYTKVTAGDMVAVDRRANGLYPAKKGLPRNTEWLKVEEVTREKKRGTTLITIFVIDTTGNIVALKWDAAHTAITKRTAA